MHNFPVYFDLERIGTLSHNSSTNLFTFEYVQDWIHREGAYPICPLIPLASVEHQSAEIHSAIVRQFFENLLPEGNALDQVSIFHQISKSNLMGLVLVLGAETSGALRIGESPIQVQGDNPLRLLTAEELEDRILQRQQKPFTVWDGKVRLSIAGYQDKIAIYKKNEQWYLVDGPNLASTWILKPPPERKALKRLPENEFICMSLAKIIDIPVATVELVRVPSPVLFVARFDRKELKTRVKRLHMIDACQALGRSSSMKYERPYGDSRDVKDIRDGVNYCDLFDF
jgi:serine/threonine-protein kinase HipA